MPFELKDMALGAAQKLMLAQAQACFARRRRRMAWARARRQSSVPALVIFITSPMRL